MGKSNRDQNKPEPTKGELEILRVLWKNGPTDLSTLCTTLRESRRVATTTVATMLKIMRDKGFVDRRGEPRQYRWFARVKERTAKRRLLDSFVDSAFDGSKRGLLNWLVEDGDLTLEDWDEVRAMLEEHERRSRES